MLEGVFREVAADRHVALRQAALRRQEWYPAPPGVAVVDASAADLVAAFGQLKADLDGHGVALARVDRLLTNDELILLASLFGLPQLQLDARHAPYVEDDVILNLRADHPETDDLEWKLLFAENYVMMHSELAGRLVAEQVRYLLFQCVVAPRRDHGGQTLLRPMQRVYESLTATQVAILSATRHAAFRDPPPLLSTWDGRVVLAVKDAEGEDLPWRFTGDEGGVVEDDVNDAIRALLAAMYTEEIWGLPWEPCLLGVFDNRRYLHGRTFAQRPSDGPARHLREIRVFTA